MAKSTTPRTGGRLAFALVAALVLIAVSHPVNDPDTWQHLRVGQTLWQLHALPGVNVWTWPTLGAPYDVPSWLFRALLWPFWAAFGVPGLFLWRWITALGLVVLLRGCVRHASRGRGDGVIGLAVILWSALLWRQRWQCRPETLVALVLAAELWVLEARRNRSEPTPIARDSAWLLVPLLVVWINTHLSYYLGLVVAGAYVLDGAWKRARGDGSAAPGRLAVITLVAAGACLANPYGWRALWQPFHFFLHERTQLIYRVVDELQPIDWRKNVWNGLPLYLLAVLALAVWRWRRVGFDAAQAVVLAVLMPQALATSRFLGLLAVATTPVLARDVEDALVPTAWARRVRSPWVRGILVLSPVVALWAVEIERTRPPLGTAVYWPRLPVRACDFMAEHHVEGRGYNMFWHGGYLLWRFWPDRGRLPFMDIHQTGSRADRDLQVLSLQDSSAWSQLDRRYQFDWVLLPSRTGTTQDLLHHLEGDTTRWALVFADDAASLLLRRGGRSSEIAHRLGYRAVRLDNIGFVELGRRILADSSLRVRLGSELDRCIGASRWSSRALSLRSTIALAEQRWSDARRDLEAALAVDPSLEKAHDRLAYALLMGGNPRGALEQIGCARRLGSSGPFIETLASQAQDMIRRDGEGDARGGERPRRDTRSSSSADPLLRQAAPAARGAHPSRPTEPSPPPWSETSV